MNLLFYIMMTLAGFCGLGLVAAAIFNHGSRVTSKRVLMVLTGLHGAKLDLRGKRKLQKKVFATTHWLRARLGMSIDSQLTERFESSGIHNSSYRDLYLAARLLGPILAVVVASFIPWNRPMMMMGLPGIAYLAPDIVLSRLTARRRERIRLSVPDAVDLLVICVDAGLGLDQAMLRVAHELGTRHPDLQQEFLRINREQRAGKQRLDAWQSMADRNKLVELDGFVNMLAQTERFGTPIARALSNFGDGIRQKRRQRAEELAAKTTVKIIFPLVLCIFPSLFIVLLGPPGIKVARGLAGLP
jgi:tight adherence protein C